MMTYKGYLGQVEFDDENHVFSGSVINIRDVITFQGESVKELEEEFRASVDDYLAWCDEEGAEPEKAYSGKFNVRISPELHRKISMQAQAKGISLNKAVEQAIAAYN